MMTQTITRIVNSRHDLAKNALIYAGRSLLVLCAVYCTLGIIISGFDFPVDMANLFLLMLISSFSVTALTTIFRLRGILLSAVPAVFLFVWLRHSISEGFQYFLQTITTRYNVWLPLPVLFPDAQDVLYASYPFIVIGIIIVFLLAVTICLSRSTALTILATLPFALLSLVLTETTPSPVFLTGLITSYLTLLICNALHPYSYLKSALWIFPAFLMAATITGAVYLAAPADKYVRSANIESIRYRINRIAQEITSAASAGSEDAFFEFNNGWFRGSGTATWAFNTSEVNVADAGARAITGLELLSISVSHPGTYYLRGFSLNDFDGRTWRNVGKTFQGESLEMPYAQELPANILSEFMLNSFDNADPELPIPTLVGMNISRINDFTNSSFIYRPYFSRELIILTDMSDDEYLLNAMNYSTRFYHVSGSVRDYLSDDSAIASVSVSIEQERISISETLPENATFDNIGQRLYDAFLTDNLTISTDDTYTALRRLAIDAGIDPTAGRAEIADQVAEYIRASGTYTLNPPEIPEGEDFALYFLQTSQAGYCIHFATAATLMLRSLDIPARFVSGYVATVRPANLEETVLTDRNAHAWVEVFYDDVGWLPLEVTPSTNVSQVPAPRPHTPAVSQAPSETPAPSTTEPAETGVSESPASSAPAAPQSRRNSPFLTWMAGFMLIFAALLFLIIAAHIRRYLLKIAREKRFAQQDTNAAVLYMWKYISKLSRMHIIIPKDIEELALRARFSPHRITEQERKYMLNYTNSIAAQLYEGKGDLGRFWFRFIRGLW